MASYTHRMLSTPQAIKSTIPNVARKAPPALDPPCSIVISFPQQLFRLHEGGLLTRSRSRLRGGRADVARRLADDGDHRIGTGDMEIFDQPGGCAAGRDGAASGWFSRGTAGLECSTFRRTTQ